MLGRCDCEDTNDADLRAAVCCSQSSKLIKRRMLIDRERLRSGGSAYTPSPARGANVEIRDAVREGCHEEVMSLHDQQGEIDSMDALMELLCKEGGESKRQG
ncbi:hypothetical protein PHSY_000857 [Pseudozyma hubeiensis SY62]|uniref:Uncharacterized protein n=1 Tax=Pseudozyma hubeiensis (strain SY62) TaxID=1305764 RepID=R9NXK2_PSEHS|nr:hypothetical protein PHSY_000857 [Pseudozyma hubeiensis SY62]GAC93292.1 hypothetical protein PHSY_000857 [Pseudozyma hubeiensis SY62]